ncbi:CKLF-like MARVEL transmembrane domain-containing protein 8 isoform X2 [Apus apus]|uniref:CKLF-like MARVEL transmembrane domain-containing protein 8 isoform X2 n=1 Tax=Apus apus TaxID=8895 RepID=UPI0021F8C251|nr:CKLF-like MARVEL transmembrane domain-containing protein 8 isoform X2 [Apus apus]XP_051468878.1 CKLF-like MARVEL transmembrane domain-containing protein 8 isoform X2 [Apus apus]
MEPVPPPQEPAPRPRSHTVTTTSSSFTANLSASSSTLAYDREFLRTLPGLLMVTEIVLGLLVWTLIAGTEYFLYPAFGWVMFVAVFYWVLTVFFLIIYMTMTYTRIPQVPWTTVITAYQLQDASGFSVMERTVGPKCALMFMELQNKQLILI